MVCWYDKHNAEARGQLMLYAMHELGKVVKVKIGM